MEDGQPDRAQAEGDRAPSRRVRRSAAAASGVVATLSAIVGIWFAFFPHDEAAQQKASLPTAGSLRVRDLVDGVPLGDFLAETGKSAKGYTAAQRDLLGVEVYLQVQVSGIERSPSLVWTLYRVVPTPRRLLPGPFAHQDGGAVPMLGDGFRGLAKLWLPLPGEGGFYSARIELAEDVATLDYADTKRFLGALPQATPTMPFQPPPTKTTSAPAPTTTTATPAPGDVPLPHVAAAFARSTR